MTSRHADQTGMAAPLVVTLTGLLLVLTVLVGGLGRLLVDQRRVSSAADLAALAGASALQLRQDPCDAAADTARRNEAELRSCTVRGDLVEVRAAVKLTGFSGLLQPLEGELVEAVALAGPVP